jgi:hypothetical protein
MAEERPARRPRRSFDIANRDASALEAAWRALPPDHRDGYCWCCIALDALKDEENNINNTSLDAYQWVLDTLAPPRPKWSNPSAINPRWLTNTFLREIIARREPLVWLVCTTPYLLECALAAASFVRNADLCRRLYERGARIRAWKLFENEDDDVVCSANLMFVLSAVDAHDVFAGVSDAVATAIHMRFYGLLEMLLARGAPVIVEGASDTEQPLWKLCFSRCGPTKVLRMLELGASPLLRDARGVLLADALGGGSANFDARVFRAILVHHACTHWTRRTHARYPREFRQRVFALLCVNHRLRALHRDTVDLVVRHMCANEEEEEEEEERAPPPPFEKAPRNFSLDMELVDGGRLSVPLTGTVAAVGLGWPDHTRRVARGLDMQFICYPHTATPPILLFYLYFQQGRWWIDPRGTTHIRYEGPPPPLGTMSLLESREMPAFEIGHAHFWLY